MGFFWHAFIAAGRLGLTQSSSQLAQEFGRLLEAIFFLLDGRLYSEARSRSCQLESYSRTSGESDHHRQSVCDVKNTAIPTEPRGGLDDSSKRLCSRRHIIALKALSASESASCFSSSPSPCRGNSSSSLKLLTSQSFLPCEASQLENCPRSGPRS